MGTGKKFMVRRGMLNTLVIATENEGDVLDFVNFKETEGGIVYSDMSGYDIPLASVLYQAPSGKYNLMAVRKTRLAAKMLKVLGETDNFYIVKEDS